ncbi:unnamed protein product [Durusdinium trenchii]|uniref:Uncharacterized protein n=1 Tax=Durusdinium trenchii TaxID=1381693 RepID=A0ABP0KX38_9DINO
MFRHSMVCLAYYDEDGDCLQRRKERYLDEMTKQVGEVLLRATTQAQTLCGMLSAQLDEKVGEHVRRMQRILEEVEKQAEKSDSKDVDELYSRLAELMVLCSVITFVQCVQCVQNHPKSVFSDCGLDMRQ